MTGNQSNLGVAFHTLAGSADAGTVPVLLQEAEESYSSAIAIAPSKAVPAITNANFNLGAVLFAQIELEDNAPRRHGDHRTRIVSLSLLMPSGRSFVDPAEAPSACWRTLPGNGPHKSKALPGLLGLLFQASTVTSSTRHAADNAAAAVNTRLYKLQWVLNKISQPAAPLLRPEPRAGIGVPRTT
jgi:hypothetical protein